VGAAGRMLPLLVLSLCAIVVLGCGDDGGGGEGGGGEPIRVGASLPLTGDLSEPGKEAQRGYELWRAQVNEDGGLLGRQVELVILDDASDQNTVVADYNALIGKERVDLLLGTFSSFLNLPASAVAERNEMVFAEPAGGSPEMFERGYHYLFFTQQATADKQADEFARWISGLPEGERPATAAYVSLDDPFTEPVISRLQSELEAAGIETVYDELYPQGTQNFDSIANAVKNADADLVAHGATALPDGAGLVRSFMKVGFDPERFFQTAAPSLGDQYVKAVREGNEEGVFFGTSYHPDVEAEGNRQFVEAYRAEYGGEPTEDAADAYASAQTLQAAVEAVGEIDQPAMADWLHENTVETILGPLSWDETGAPQESYLLAQWQNGEIEIVLPENLATADAIVDPKPPWD
jgi:branched-chain amino acid transport system substrate-binding protein